MTVTSSNLRADIRDQLTSSEFVAFLRAELLCQVVEQTAHAAASRATVARLTGVHDGDSALDREIADVAAHRADLAVVEARHALAKLDDGTYGACEQCGDTLPIERLEVIPHTRFCVRCATAIG